MTVDARLAVAVAAGKAAAAASRLLRRGGGTTIPGDVALAVDPAALAKLGARLRHGTVLVTGTNGKTTTTGLLAAALEAAGRRVLTNHSGANLVFGLTAAAVADASASGVPRADTAVFEVDELSLERAVVALRPRLVVVLNLLRDQLDRSGELETTADRIGAALRRLDAGACVVANVDDPLVLSRCAGPARLVGVGIDADDHLLPALPHAADARACPRCGEPLHFARVVLAHCGTYSCAACGFARPRPDLAVARIDATSIESMHLVLSDGAEVTVAVGGVYNAVNVAAAYAAAVALGVPGDVAVAALGRFRARFGRQETLVLHGARLRMLLAKNPAGFDEALRAADELGRCRTYLVAINDLVADGRDVSWLWDVDFERLARSPLQPRVVAAGRRAHDLAVRLKYAGVPIERVLVETEPEAALRRVAALVDDGEEAAILPTYTAMLELRAVAQRLGAVEAFWRRDPTPAPAAAQGGPR